MTYETVISELFNRFPDLADRYRSTLPFLQDEPPMQYIVFGSVFIPAFEDALEHSQTDRIASLCAFLETVSLGSLHDSGLEDLVRVEIGEWLGGLQHEDRLMPFLGESTKRVCQYVPGLATQRLALAVERKARNPINRLKGWLKRNT